MSQGGQPRRLVGTTVVVTGGSGVQGAAEVERLVAEGANVISLDVVEPATPIPGASYRMMDIGDRGDWERLSEELSALGVRVHGLVNNAAVQSSARLHELDEEELQRVLQVNLSGSLWGTQFCSGLMDPGASIINVSSAAGTNAWFAAAYTMSKWALRGLTKVSSLELAAKGIRVNTIIPGLVRSAERDNTSPLIAATIDLTPMGRPGRPSEVADLVVFLLSRESTYISGAEIAIDGGFASHGGAKLQLDSVL